MPYYLGDMQGAQGVTPAADYNVQTPAAIAAGTANPAPPADHAQQTPEFLQKLIMELQGLVQEQSAVFAEMYKPHSPITHESMHIDPPYEVMEELRRKDRELDLKIWPLKSQIRELRVLLARPGVTPEPELITVEGPSGPSTPEMAAQSPVPTKTGMEPGGSVHFGEAPPIQPKR